MLISQIRCVVNLQRFSILSFLFWMSAVLLSQYPRSIKLLNYFFFYGQKKFNKRNSKWKKRKGSHLIVVSHSPLQEMRWSPRSTDVHESQQRATPSEFTPNSTECYKCENGNDYFTTELSHEMQKTKTRSFPIEIASSLNFSYNNSKKIWTKGSIGSHDEINQTGAYKIMNRYEYRTMKVIQ